MVMFLESMGSDDKEKQRVSWEEQNEAKRPSLQEQCG